MKISIFGLGIIGSVWAKNFMADGHEVRTWNRTRKNDAPGFLSNAKMAARDAELIAIVVSDALAVHSVLSQIESELKPGMVVAVHSTIGVSEVIGIAKQVQTTGAEFLDMPFTGSKAAAENRQTIFYVGDDSRALDVVEAAYAKLSRNILEIGHIGQAMALKLCMNLMIANLYQALAEGLQLATRAQISPEAFFSVLEQNVSRSGVSDMKRDKILTNDFSPHFSVKHMHKDINLALRLGMDFDQPLPQTQTLSAAYQKAEQMGLGDLDFSALIQTLTK